MTEDVIIIEESTNESESKPDAMPELVQKESVVKPAPEPDEVANPPSENPLTLTLDAPTADQTLPQDQNGLSETHPVAENGHQNGVEPKLDTASAEEKPSETILPNQEGEQIKQEIQNGHEQESTRESLEERPEDDKPESEQMRKLFIGGLTFNTTESDLRDHFGKFGKIVDSVVMVDPQTKKSRCFGFVTYERAYMVDEAQKNRPHIIHDRTVEPKRAIPREMSSKPGSQSTVTKCFVGGVKEGLEEADLKEYFSKFGNVTSVDIITEKGTTKKRGFAFITYDDYDPVDKLTLVRNHTVKGFRLETQKAVSKEDIGRDGGRERDSHRGGRDSYRDRSPPRDYRDRGDRSGGRGGRDRSYGGHDDRYSRGRETDRYQSPGGYGSRDYRGGPGAGGGYGAPASSYGSRGGSGGWESNARDYNPTYGGHAPYGGPTGGAYNPPPPAGGYGQGGYGGPPAPGVYDNRYGMSSGGGGGYGSGPSGYPAGGAGSYGAGAGSYGAPAGGPMRAGSYGDSGSRPAPYSARGGYGGSSGGRGGGGGYGRR